MDVAPGFMTRISGSGAAEDSTSVDLLPGAGEDAEGDAVELGQAVVGTGRDQDRRWCGIEEDSPSWPDVWQVEVIADVLGLPPPPLRRGWPPSVCFSAAEIGRRQYNCAKSAVSRAVRRLEDRGLIEVRIYGRRHAAIRLAEDGGGP